ncbi:MAG: alcohol dehydrogenase family protein [SAR324 cluster bacterium]|nr:alcohol dehydrogenase family protein [SAR324 cluster bacterium]
MNQMTKSMKGVWLTGHGELDKLDVRNDIPVPKLTANDVLIRVGAAAVNNTDINTRTAWYSKGDATIKDASWAGIAIDFPRVQGIDVCGHIVAVGKNVSNNRIGERVLVEPCLREVKGNALSYPWFLGSECDGGFAEFVAVASRHAYQVKSELSDVELASFPCSYSTAENMLTKSKVLSGELVLVTGASGGVGSAAVQLIKARGADVIAVTSGSKSQDLLTLGASKTLNRDQRVVEALGSNSVDVVIDLVGGKSWPEFLEVLRPGGRYVVSGAIAGAIVGLDLRTLYLKDLSFFGCTVLESKVFTNIIDHIESGNIKPIVAHTFPLEDIVKAQELFLLKQHIGKIVLTINS